MASRPSPTGAKHVGLVVRAGEPYLSLNGVTARRTSQGVRPALMDILALRKEKLGIPVPALEELIVIEEKIIKLGKSRFDVDLTKTTSSKRKYGWLGLEGVNVHAEGNSLLLRFRRKGYAALSLRVRHGTERQAIVRVCMYRFSVAGIPMPEADLVDECVDRIRLILAESGLCLD